MLKHDFEQYLLPTLRHYGKLVLRPAYRRRSRELARVRSLPRHTPGVSRLLGVPFEFLDSISFWQGYQELFERQLYRFRPSHSRPRVLDGGANAGLSVVFFKQTYPDCRLTAFEADPRIFATLQRNVAAFGWADVELVPKALWSEDTTLEFLPQGGEVSRIPQSRDAGPRVRVPACRLSPYLEEPVDLLKLDIEGAEAAVLRECAGRLGQVHNLLVESHSFAGQPQTLAEILNLLDQAGFRLHLHALVPAARPLWERETHYGMDCQVNIFGFRE